MSGGRSPVHTSAVSDPSRLVNRTPNRPSAATVVNDPIVRAQLDQAIAGAACPGVGLLVAGDLNAAAQAPELAAIAKGLDPRAPPTLQGEHVERRSMSAAAIDHLALAQPGGWMITNRFRALDRPDAEGWFPSDHAAVVADLVRL